MNAMRWLVGAGGNRHVASPDSASALNACYTTFPSDLLYDILARLNALSLPAIFA